MKTQLHLDGQFSLVREVVPLQPASQRLEGPGECVVQSLSTESEGEE